MVETAVASTVLVVREEIFHALVQDHTIRTETKFEGKESKE